MWQKMAVTMKNASVEVKIKVAMGCFAILLAVASILAGLFTFGLKTRILSFGEATEASKAISTCRLEINQSARRYTELVVGVDSAKFEAYQKNLLEDEQSVSESVHLLEGKEYISHDRLIAYHDGIDSWYADGKRIISALSEGNQDEARRILQEESIPALDRLVEYSDQINEEIVNELYREYETSNVMYIVSMILNTIFMVFGFIAGSFLRKKLCQDIFTPVDAVYHAAKQMEEGHLNLEIDYESEDEMGQMAKSLRHAADTLHAYIKDISKAMAAFSQGHFDVMPEVEWSGDFYEIYLSIHEFEKSMSKLVTELYSVAEQVDRSAAQVASSANSLAQGATDQSVIIQKLAATIESVSGQISENADHAKIISQSVEVVREEIINSNVKMSEMVSSMQEISDSSKKIGNIIATINDIASQTNLLALNASIEAARAGEAGRGFAVVADQVSALAAQSAEAAKESTYLIENSVNAVEKGMVIAEKTAEQLAMVVESSRSITEEVGIVAKVLGKQAESFMQINSGVEHISDVIQSNSAVSQECAAASEEMNAQANGLEQLIRSFKVLPMNE